MKFEETHVGGIEPGPVTLRYPGGNEGLCQRYIYRGRQLLGELKQRMQMDSVGYAKTDLTLPDGVKLHAQSNMLGLADSDEVWIDVKSLTVGNKDKCTGFIIRIKTQSQRKLGISVKEPGETTDINTYIDSFNKKAPKVYTNTGSTSEFGDNISLDDDNITYDMLDPAIGPDAGQYKKHTFHDADWVYPGTSNKRSLFSGSLELFVIKIILVSPPFPTFPWSHVTGETTTTSVTDGVQVSYSLTGSAPTHGGTIDIDDRSRFDPSSTLNTGSWDAVWDNEENALALTETNTTYGAAPGRIVQNTTDPVTRYFGTDYEINNGRVAVGPEANASDFTSFASVLPGPQKYKRRSGERTENIFKNTVKYLMAGGQGHLTLLNQTVEYINGNEHYWYTVQETVTSEIDTLTLVPEWTFNSAVKSGKYECAIFYSDLEDFGDVDVEVDVLLYGSTHFKTFNYADQVINRKSTKKILIDVGKEVDFIDGMANPYIAVVDNN